MGYLIHPSTSSASPGSVGRTLCQVAEGMSIPGLLSISVRHGLGNARTSTPSIGQGGLQVPVNSEDLWIQGP